MEAGELLMELDTADLEFAMQKAEASYASAVASYESSVASANKTLGSDYTSKIISAENSLEKAESSYRTARLNYKEEIDSEDQDIDRKMEAMDKAMTEMENALDAFNKSKSDGSTQEEQDALREDYYSKRDLYNKAADSYADALDGYDDYKSSVATSKNNAYKDLVQAQDTLELTTGDAYTEQKAVTEAQLKSAKLSLEASQLSLEEAQRNLDKTRVYSPVSGKITARDAEQYAMASSNSPAFTIKNDDSVQLKFNATADGASSLSVGDELTVTRSANTYKAAITKIETEADASSGLFPITAQLEDGADLLPGVTVKVAATTAKAENVLMVPIDHVYYDVDQPYVFTYEDGKAHRADIVTGMSNESTIVVEDGLNTNSLIITTWHPDLADGASVVLGEGMEDLVNRAAAMDATPAASLTASGTAKKEPVKTTSKAKQTAADDDEDAEDADAEEHAELLYDSADEDDSFGVELPADPVYPDTPVMKDLSPPYVGNASTASEAMAKSVVDSASGGMLNSKAGSK